jgi:hypothetical protein
MEHLCRMAYFGQDICEELVIDESGSFDVVWKQYDDCGEPLIIPQLRKLYINPEFACPGVWSFLKEVFPNCEIVLR